MYELSGSLQNRRFSRPRFVMERPFYCSRTGNLPLARGDPAMRLSPQLRGDGHSELRAIKLNPGSVNEKLKPGLRFDGPIDGLLRRQVRKGYGIKVLTDR
jgi:hypothetical protein